MTPGHPIVLALAITALGSSVSAVMHRQVHYLINWAQYRPAGCEWEPKDFRPKLATHVNFAFAWLTPDFAPKLLDWRDEILLGQMRDLKKKNPKLKLMVSIGGAGMNAADSDYRFLFSQAVATKESRAKFINSAVAFCDKYGLTGVDIDWESPGVPELGGQPGDKAGLVALMQEFRQAVTGRKPRFWLSIATPQFCSADDTLLGCDGFDLAELHPSVDFFNVMTYIYHSPDWESSTNYHTPWEGTDPNAWGIKRTLDYYLSVGVPPAKINLGLALFGVSWTLSDPSSTGVGAPSSGPGMSGPCTPSEPIGWRDLRDMIDSGAQLHEDTTTARAAYLVQGDQWIAFDSPNTIAAKIAAARELGLGGLMVWESSYDDEKYTMAKTIKRGKPAPVVPSSPKPEQACGDGVVGNKQCLDHTQCCSKFGWCWVDDDHCKGDNCVGGPCYP